MGVMLSAAGSLRWLRDVVSGRPAIALLQLLVPIPAWILLLVAIVPFAVVRPILDPRPGSGLPIFGVLLALFAAVSAYGVFGPDRGKPDGEGQAILELSVAFASRIAIQVFFLAGLILMGIVATLPVLAIVAFGLLAAELPLARLVRSRRDAALSASVRQAATLAGAHGR